MNTFTLNIDYIRIMEYCIINNSKWWFFLAGTVFISLYILLLNWTWSQAEDYICDVNLPRVASLRLGVCVAEGNSATVCYT